VGWIAGEGEGRTAEEEDIVEEDIAEGVVVDVVEGVQLVGEAEAGVVVSPSHS